jgi:hypothetical protein
MDQSMAEEDSVAGRSTTADRAEEGIALDSRMRNVDAATIAIRATPSRTTVYQIAPGPLLLQLQRSPSMTQ